MPVDTPHPDYQRIAPKWEKCRDTREGSDAVKSKTTKYLPRLDIHEQKPAKYNEYLLRAYFYGAMKRTVEGLAGAILQKAPAVQFPENLNGILQDVTLTSVPFQLLVLKAVDESMTVGRYGVLVDMATAEAPDQRPYAAPYFTEDIISWRTERRGGDRVLVRVVLRETVEELDPKDPFKMKSGVQYRVLELGDDGYSQTVYVEERENSGKFLAQEPILPERRSNRLGFIPFVFIGSEGISPTPSIPPLDALADTNLSHYRNSADYEHGLHYTGVPIPWVAGVMGSNDGTPIALGPTHMLQLDKDGRAGIIQADGNMLGALEKALDRKQKLMATLGARLLEEQASTQETATAVGMRHAGEHASLRTVAQAVELGLTKVLQWLAWWAGTSDKPEDTGATVELNKEFLTVKMSPAELHELVLSLQAEQISYPTFYHNISVGGVAREGVTWEEELAAITRDRESIERLEPAPVIPGVGADD